MRDPELRQLIIDLLRIMVGMEKKLKELLDK